MSAYTLAVIALFVAAVFQTGALWLCVEAFFANGQTRSRRVSWFALGSAALFLALHAGHALELALRTGLFDLRQSLLAVLVSCGLVIAAIGFRRA